MVDFSGWVRQRAPCAALVQGVAAWGVIVVSVALARMGHLVGIGGIVLSLGLAIAATACGIAGVLDARRRGGHEHGSAVLGGVLGSTLLLLLGTTIALCVAFAAALGGSPD